MANTKSAKKSIRQISARTAVNRNRRSRVRTFLKKVEASIAEGNHANALAALRVAESEIFRAVSKGIYKKNTASRTVSRLNTRIKALAA